MAEPTGPNRDTKTLAFDFGDSTHDSLQEQVKRMGELIAYIEVAEERVSEWTKDIEKIQQDNQEYFQQQIVEIRDAIQEMQSFMSEVGIARFKISARTILEQGKEHINILNNTAKNQLDSIEACNQEFKQLVHFVFQISNA